MTIEHIYNYIKSNINKSPYDVIIELSKKYDPTDIELVYNMEFDIFLNDDLTNTKIKRLDDKFRKNVRNIFDNKCIITNVSVERCDVAHIKPFNKCNEIEKYDINNGLLLDTALHRLFDKYYFSINPDTYMIEVNMNIKNLKKLKIEQYNSNHLNLDKFNKKYLQNHYSIFIKKNL